MKHCIPSVISGDGFLSQNIAYSACMLYGSLDSSLQKTNKYEVPNHLGVLLRNGPSLSRALSSLSPLLYYHSRAGDRPAASSDGDYYYYDCCSFVRPSVRFPKHHFRIWYDLQDCILASPACRARARLTKEIYSKSFGRACLATGQNVRIVPRQ